MRWGFVWLMVCCLAGGAWADEGSRDKAYVSDSYLNAYKLTIHFYNPRLESEVIDEIARSILFYSHTLEVDPRLVVAVIATESRFDVRAVSRHGAQGLGQLMPGTAGMLKVDAWQAWQNVQGCVRVMKLNLDRFAGLPRQRRLEYALAAYNAGYGAVMKAGGIPQNGETPNYVRKVLSIYGQLTSGDN